MGDLIPILQIASSVNHLHSLVLGPDENLFRVDWLSDSRTMTIQLIGKDDDKHDDTEAMTERWQAYIESFVSVRLQLYFRLRCNTDRLPASLYRWRAHIIHHQASIPTPVSLTTLRPVFPSAQS